jgi:hypothetical protein
MSSSVFLTRVFFTNSPFLRNVLYTLQVTKVDEFGQIRHFCSLQNVTNVENGKGQNA